MNLEFYNQIPNELRELPQWVLWRMELRDEKWTKVPYGPRTKYKASITNPADWGTYADAVASIKGFNGIGFVFTENDPYAGIDLDNKTGDPTLYEKHERILSKFHSYAEASPSRTGLHILVRGRVPKGKKTNDVEIYSSGRFFTMTGNVVSKLPIADCQQELNELFQEIGGKLVTDNSIIAPTLSLPVEAPHNQSDREIIARIAKSKCAEKYLALSRGDKSAVKGADTSGSAIDLSLLGWSTPIFRSRD